MSPLEPLAPDQRAVVALVLQQGRSYDEIASLLGMPVEGVRARAHAGLASLASDNGLPAEITGPLADYLLGQQPPRDAEATRGLLAESASARAWATDVAAGLEDVAPSGLPEIPGADAPAAPKTGTSRAAKDSSKTGTSRAANDAAGTGSSAAAKQPPGPGSSGAATDPSRTGASRAAKQPPGPGSSAAAAAPGPRPRPVREPPPPAAGDDSPPAASRLGGILLIAGVLAVVAVVLILVLGGGDDDPAGEQVASSPTPAASATPTPTATPQVADAIPLRSTTGGKARGTMTVFLQDGRLLFALEAQNVPPSGDRAAYAVWFTGPGNKARRLGFTAPVGEDGRLGIQGPSEKDSEDFPKLYATYEKVVVSRETTENAKRPGPVLLSGKLPKGR